ncbi:MAG: prenyltransferase/squalene oxidase repeat-containing protein [Gemmataceae bacterium]
MFDPYEKWLGIPKARRPVDYFLLLDLDPGERDPDVIQEAAERQAGLVTPHQGGPHDKACTRLLAEIDKAMDTLLSPVKRKAYLAKLRERDDEEDEPDEGDRPRRGRGRKGQSRREAEPAPVWPWLVLGGGGLVVLAAVGGVVFWQTRPKAAGDPPPASAVAAAQPAPIIPAPAPAPAPVPTPPVVVATPPPPPQPKPAPAPLSRPPAVKRKPAVVKLPVPDQVAQDKAEKALKEKYKAAYEKATSEGQLALAAKLYQPGREDRGDPAAWFVLWREARDAAVRAVRPRFAAAVVNEIDTYFLIDAAAMKAQALAQVSELADGARAAVKTALAQVEPALAEDNYEAATRMLDAADAAARKGKPDERLTSQIASRRSQVLAFENSYREVAAAREKLKAAPDDAPANLAVGRHLCLFHGRWDEGLPYLGKGGDAEPARLARQDLTPPADVKAQLAVADAWSRMTEDHTERPRRHLYERALAWYDVARPNVAAKDQSKLDEKTLQVRKKLVPNVRRLVPGSYFGRSDPEDRALLLREGGGNVRSEAAVESGLEWLARHQDSTGKWATEAFHRAGKCKCGDPGQQFDIAGTAFGLLPFLGAGETHKHGRYRRQVQRGLTGLVTKQKPEGKFSDNAYENALATLAVCEAVGQAKDKQLAGAAQRAVNFLAAAQHPEGSWGYSPGAKGDTSVTGWQFSALKAGYYAGLNVPPSSFVRAGLFLNTVADPGGLGYGYNTPGAGRATSATGQMVREYLGLPPSHHVLAKGIDYLLRPENFVTKEKPSIYFLFYATQVMHHAGGDAWETWNPKARDLLIELQDQGKVEGREHQKGSWSPSGDEWATQGGRLMFTSLALITLEVYYYHIPLNGFGPAVLDE